MTADCQFLGDFYQTRMKNGDLREEKKTQTQSIKQYRSKHMTTKFTSWSSYSVISVNGDSELSILTQAHNSSK